VRIYRAETHHIVPLGKGISPAYRVQSPERLQPETEAPLLIRDIHRESVTKHELNDQSFCHGIAVDLGYLTGARSS
jgi:hypothetical protein